MDNAGAEIVAGGLSDIAHALDGVATSIYRVADALNRLGTANAATEMGAIEYLAVSVKESGKNIVSILTAIHDAGL